MSERVVLDAEWAERLPVAGRAPATTARADSAPAGCQPCAVCGTRAFSRRFLLGDLRVVRCQRCGLQQVNPRPDPEALRARYPDSYFLNGYLPDILDPARNHRARAFRRGLRDLRRLRPEGRLLDVGCAVGFFLNLARESGYDCLGLEPSPMAAQWARDHLGLDVVTGDLTTAALAPASFDIITVWDVLHEQPDPLAMLRRIAALLAEAGIVLIKVPDVECLPFRAISAAYRWTGGRLRRGVELFYQYQVHHFSKATLAATLERAGLRVIRQRNETHRNLARLSEKRWGRSPAVRAGVAGLTLASRVLGMEDEIVCYASKQPR
jgi:SAM-dependent methyltransferase